MGSKYKLGGRLRKHLEMTVNAAIALDKSIVTVKDKLHEAKGHSEQYLNELGLTRSDLKRLETCGFAMRGYTKNIWVEGDILPNGKTVGKDEMYRGPGRRVVWTLVAG